jgi:hypothetical protein
MRNSRWHTVHNSSKPGALAEPPYRAGASEELVKHFKRVTMMSSEGVATTATTTLRILLVAAPSAVIRQGHEKTGDQIQHLPLRTHLIVAVPLLIIAQYLHETGN